MTIHIFGQDTDVSFPRVTPLSPTVSAMERFGSYPINYNTGTVAISTDLYSFPLGKGLNLDIRLNYHPSGIKVEDISGRMGTGWSLITAGYIAREIRGLRDELPGGFYNLIKKHNGYTFPENIDPITHSTTLDSIADGFLDPSPDIFSLNAPGLNCRFFIGSDGEFHTIPYSNIKIKKHPSFTGNGDEGNWEVINESGVHYIFKDKETTWTNNKSDYYVSTWHLSSIISPEGIILAEFEYGAGVEDNYPNITRRTLGFNSSSTPDFPGRDSYLDEKSQSIESNKFTTRELYKINIPGKGRIVFEKHPTPALNLIEKVQYYNEQDSLENSYTFSYEHESNRPYLSKITKTGGDKSYLYRSFYYYKGLPDSNSNAQDLWGYYNGATTNKTLYVYYQGLGNYESADRYPTDKAKAGSLKEIIYPTGGKTHFEYENNTVYSPDSISTIKKEHFSLSLDSYGDTIGSFTTVGCEIDIDMDIYISPNGEFMEIQLLDITRNLIKKSFVTGDLSDFTHIKQDSDGSREHFVGSMKGEKLLAGTYQWIIRADKTGLMRAAKEPSISISHGYYRKVYSPTGERLVGGLRIASISNYDKDETLIDKTRYTYTNKDGRCSGVPAPEPEFVRSYVVRGEIPTGGWGNAEPVYMTVAEIGEVNLRYYNGSPVQYTYVIEEKLNANQGRLRTDYEYMLRYFNHTPLPGPAMSYNYVPYSANEYTEGLLIHKTDYKYENGIYTPIRKESSNYEIKDWGDGIPAFKALHLNKYYISSTNRSTYPMDQRYQFGRYDIKAAKFYLSSKKTEEIASSGTITNLTEYFYENPQYHQLTSTRQTGSNQLISEANYKYFFDNTSVISDSMKVRNMVSYPFEVIRKVNNQQVARLKNTYDFFNSNKIIELKSSQKQTTSNSEFSGVIYHNYDSYGNPIFITQNEADSITYLWSYKGQYPVAEIKNATYDQVKTALENTTLESISLLSEPNMEVINKLRNKLPNALISTYTYNPLIGVSSVTDPMGLTTHYEYDEFGRLESIKDHEGNIIESYKYHYHNQ